MLPRLLIGGAGKDKIARDQDLQHLPVEAGNLCPFIFLALPGGAPNVDFAVASAAINPLIVGAECDPINVIAVAEIAVLHFSGLSIVDSGGFIPAGRSEECP